MTRLVKQYINWEAGRSEDGKVQSQPFTPVDGELLTVDELPDVGYRVVQIIWMVEDEKD